ncbi:MAG TPA: glycosyltransferase [Candidatus Binatia bacterium]|nr:glycosyltransferase [Candidatus Binatia bacterium]
MSLRILITNNTLAGRAGTELYVRDVALALLDRGYSPIAYSSLLGEVADELRAATVTVIDRLDALAVAPDLIHGHHHLETMTALLHFPNVPALSFCHGWLPWEEMPPKFPRISRYVAVDETCRDRLILEHAIPEERVRLLPNFVDLKRFKSRAALPPKPKRALVFSNYASEENILPAIRAACAQSNISLDAIGVGSRNSANRPELLLPNYDLVFAKGRAALEALAVDNAVVLCDAVGVGPMVTTENREKLRRLNFGIRALRNPMETGVLCHEIARYNATDAARVCAWVRDTAGMESALDDLVNLYSEVVEEHKRTPAPDAAAEMRAASTYLRHWVRNLTAQHEARVQHEHLRNAHQKQRRECDLVIQQYRQLQEEHERLKDEVNRLHNERKQLDEERQGQFEEHRHIKEKYEILHRDLDSLREQHGQLQLERQRLQSDLAEVFSSSTLRLRDRVVGLPFVGTWLKSFARMAAGRLS